MSPGTKKTVLIADDTVFMRKMLRDIFEAHEIEVVAEAGNGKEAVELYEKHLPDFVTMDIAMPEMDGLHALKGIREIDPVAVVIMVSSMGFQEKVIEAIRLGAKNFIVKPFTESKVMEVVNKTLPGL
jgi:two-component system chemotaxis response regulator CheY